MEYLRWILLAAGLFFVLIIYLIGSNRRRKDARNDYDLDDEAPEFSAKDWDELEEGVGEVRIVAREASDYDPPEYDSYSEVEANDAQDHVQDVDEVLSPATLHWGPSPNRRPAGPSCWPSAAVRHWAR